MREISHLVRLDAGHSMFRAVRCGLNREKVSSQSRDNNNNNSKVSSVASGDIKTDIVDIPAIPSNKTLVHLTSEDSTAQPQPSQNNAPKKKYLRRRDEKERRRRFT